MSAKRTISASGPDFRLHRSLFEALSIATQGWRPAPKAVITQRAIPLDVRLHREGIRRFRETIHLQPGDWLIKHFGPGREYPVNVNKLMKNIIWQIREESSRASKLP